MILQAGLIHYDSRSRAGSSKYGAGKSLAANKRQPDLDRITSYVFYWRRTTRSQNNFPPSARGRFSPAVLRAETPFPTLRCRSHYKSEQVKQQLLRRRCRLWKVVIITCECVCGWGKKTQREPEKENHKSRFLLLMSVLQYCFNKTLLPRNREEMFPVRSKIGCWPLRSSAPLRDAHLKL